MKSNVILDFINKGLKLKLGEKTKNKKRCHSKVIPIFTHKILDANANIFIFTTLNF